MPVIAGVTFTWTDYTSPTTPRVMRIPLAAGDVTLQDIWDTLSEEAAKLENLCYAKLLDRPKGGGKSDLGGTRFTGITAMLNNLQIQFEPNVVVLENGTVTTADAAGAVLNDSAATFITNGVARGDIVQNLTDNSSATVLRVVSETQLETDGLTGGTDGQFAFGDSYQVMDMVQRAVVDGNILAQDSAESSIKAILSSFGVDASKESSTSPALNEVAAILNDTAANLLAELHRMRGLDASNPLTQTPSGESAGGISTTFTGDGVNSTTTTRNP